MSATVKVYTTSYCGYCGMAKALLARREIAFEEIDVSADDDMRNWLVKETGRMTVPQIFIGGESVGGYDELSAMDASGELATRIGGEPA